MNFFVIGGYTHSNPGDEAILLSTLSTLNELKPGSHFTIWTSAQDTEVKLPEGLKHEFFVFDPLPSFLKLGPVRGLYRKMFPLSSGLLRRLGLGREAFRRMRASDAVVFVGGGYLNSHYNLLEMQFLGRLAEQSARPVILLGQSIGPLTSKKDREIAKHLCQYASAIVVREPFSLAEVSVFGNVRLSIDDAFALKPSPLGPSAEKLVEKKENEILLALNLTKVREEADIMRVSQALDQFASALAPRKLRVVFVPMEVSRYCDDRMDGRKFERIPRSYSFSMLDERLKPSEVSALVARVDLLVSMRLHLVVFGLTHGVPSIGLYQDDYYRQKLVGIMKGFEAERYALPLPPTVLASSLTVLYTERTQMHERLLRACTEGLERRRRIYLEIFS